jgi:hypothetical protein
VNKTFIGPGKVQKRADERVTLDLPPDADGEQTNRREKIRIQITARKYFSVDVTSRDLIIFATIERSLVP